MLGYIFKRRLYTLFLDSSNGVAIGLRYLMLFFSVIYAFLIAFLLDLFHKKSPLTPLAVTKFEAGLLLLVVSFFVIKQYFPQYKSSTSFISTIYPISTIKRAFGHLINDLTSSLLLAVVLMYSILVAFSTPLSLHSAPALTFALLAWINVERNLRRLFDFNVHRASVHFLLVSTLIGLLIAAFFFHFQQGFQFSWFATTGFYGLMLIVSFVHTLWIDASIIDNRESVQSENAITETSHLVKLLVQLTWKQNKTRIAFLVAIGTKLFLGAVIIGFSQKGPNDVFVIYTYLIFSPLVIVSHVLANFFGFYRDFWLAMQVYGRSEKANQWMLVQFMLLAILVDFVLSLGIIVMINALSLKLIINYVLSVPIAIVLSLYASYSKPFFVEKPVSMSSKPNTSPLVGIGVVIVAFMFAFLAEKDVVVWTIPFVVFFSFVAFKKWPTYSAKWSPTIYDKLFKR